MNKLNYLALLGLIALVSTTYAEPEEEDDVLVLTDDNFDEAIESNSILLVEFYAPWCGHCKSLAPEYAKAAKALMERDEPIRIAKVDATAQTKVAEKFKIQGFPTLKFFKGDANSPKDYDGGRTADEIESWMIKKAGPTVRIVDTQDALDELTKANDVVVVAVLKSLDGENKVVIEKVSDSIDGAVFVVTKNVEIAKKYQKTAPALILLKNFDEGVNHYTGDFKVEDVSAFVKQNYMPLVITFSQEKAPQIFGGEISHHLLLFSDDSKEYHQKFLEAAKKSAKKNKGKLLHINIPVSEDRILEFFALNEASLPAVMLVNMEKGMKKFAYESKGEKLIGELDDLGEALIVFVDKYFAGSLKSTLKSAEPVDDSEAAVKIIVGKDFKERVVDSDKDVLLEFYAPWCGHCKNLAPKYEELAEKFSGVDSIMIAKIDATENEVDHPGVDVQGFPTIIFFPAKNKMEPVSYDGGRDVNGFTEFLKKNARKFELDGESHGVDHDEL